MCLLYLQVREAAYDLLLILCKSHPLVGVGAPSLGGREGEKDTAEAAQSVRVRKMMCSLLLRGLTDPDSEGMDGHGEEDSEEDEPDDAMDLELIDDEAERSGSLMISRGSGKPRVGIRRRVFDFFNDQFGLSGDPYVRLNVLMTKLFEPSRTDCWLHYSTYLMISLSTGNAEQYSKPLFPHQLMADSSFTPMYLSAGRQGQGHRQGQGSGGSFNSSSLPLFSLERTQSSQSQAQWDNNAGMFGTQSRDLGPRRAGFIRGTQEVSWMQTQYPNAPGGTAPVGGSNSRQEFQFRNPLSTQSLFTPGVAPPKGIAGTQSGGRRGRVGGSQTAGGTGLMGPPTGLPSYFVGREVSTVTQRVPRRFKKKVYSSQLTSRGSSDTQGDADGDQKQRSTSTSSGFYGALAARAAKKAADDRLKRTAKVVVYRSYKEGELPDICIPLCDLLKPLQGLCLRDPKAASTIFSSLFDALYLTVPLNSPEATAMRMNLNDLLCTANSQSTHFAATMLSSCSQCLEVEDPRHTRNKGARPQGQGLLSFTPIEAVAKAALKSLNFHAGIQYLEGLLLVTARIKKCPIPKAAGGKKGRKSTAPVEDMQVQVGTEGLPEVRDEKIVWRQLSVLYSALGENDILLGLAERVGAYPRQTRRAIDAEVCGDYRKAVSLYGELFDLARKRYELGPRSTTICVEYIVISNI